MAFGDVTASTNGNAGALFGSTAAKAGIKGVGSLSDIAQLQLVVANLLLADPTTVVIPAADISAGTFGAGDYVFPGALTITGALTLLAGALSSSATLGIGYAVGAGGVVTQASNRSTAVSLSTTVGRITGNATSLAAGATASFTVLNTVVAATDIVLLAVQSGPTANTSVFSIASVADGSFVIKAWNIAASAGDVGAPLINFAVLKGAIT